MVTKITREDIRQALQETLQVDLNSARLRTDRNPSEAKKKYGNYKKGKVSVNGFLITIENPKGSYRSGTDRDGKEWKVLMNHDYGYFNRTVGKDGDAIDVFIGDALNSKRIFAIDQKVKGKFDETKIMFCFNNEADARKGYLSNYEKGWKGLWKITETDIDTFKKWLYDGHRQRKPFADYVAIKNAKKLTLNESEVKYAIQEAVNKYALKRSIINKIYKAVRPITFNRRYHDEYWQGVTDVREAIESIGLSVSIYCENGGYRNEKGGNTILFDGSACWKEYKLEIEEPDTGIIINGHLNCNAAGTVENPFETYDLTLTLY